MTLLLQELESILWSAANALRGPVDPADFKTYVFPMLFFKWISDSWDYEHAQAVAEYVADVDPSPAHHPGADGPAGRRPDGLREKGTVHHVVRKTLAQTATATAVQDLRQLEADRLDALQLGLWRCNALGERVG